MNAFSFNTAIARIFEYVSALTKYDSLDISVKNVAFLKDCVKDLLLILAPMAPHFSEELWSQAGNKKSIFTCDYPVYNEQALIKDEVELAVQINSKVKAKINVSSDASDDEIKAIALENEIIKKIIGGGQVVKVIIVKGRLVNLIVKG